MTDYETPAESLSDAEAPSTPVEDVKGPGATDISDAPSVPVEGLEGAGDTDITLAPSDGVEGPVEGFPPVEMVATPEEIPNFLEVPFSDYSVTDGLLLLLLVCAFLAVLWNIVKEVF